jgi:AsmA family protein
MRIRWRRMLWVVIAMTPVAVAGVLAWNSARDLSRYQARLVEQIHKVTGRQLAARVPLSVRIGREPTLVAEGVTLSNAPWGLRSDLARVRRVTMFFDPLWLLLGEARVGRILLEGADIQVERNEVGDTNLEMLPPVEGSGPHARENRSLRQKADPAFPWINTIEVRDSVLTVMQGQGRSPVVLEVARATLRSSAPNQTMQIETRLAMPQAAALDLAGSIGTFDGWMRGLPGNIDLQGGFGGGRIAVKGSIGVKGTNLQITSEGPDIAVFGPYVQLPLPIGGPYLLNAKAGTLRGGFKADVLSLRVGDSELHGEALFRTDRHGVPNVTINVEAAKIDVAWPRGGLPASAVDPPPPAQRRLVPATPFALDWFGRSTVSMAVRVGEVSGLSGKVQNGSVTLSASERRFTFRAAASIGAGSAGFDLVYDPGGRTGQATLTATASRVSLEDFAGLLGLDLGLKDSVADVDLRLRGGGRNVRDALATASGAIDVAVAKGVWPRDGLEGWPQESLRLLAASDAGASFNCLASRFEVSGGVASLRRLVVDTPRATWVGGGFLHMRNESWEFILVPEARDTRSAALASPLRLKGGAGQALSGSLEPDLSRLLIGRGTVPSLVGTFNQIARQPGINACAAMAPKVDALRPGLRAQLPVPPTATRAPRRPGR